MFQGYVGKFLERGNLEVPEGKKVSSTSSCFKNLMKLPYQFVNGFNSTPINGFR